MQLSIFYQTIESTVSERPDTERLSTERMSTQCFAHLGHIFTKENFTRRNIRHCVNSNVLNFVEDSLILNTEKAIVAGSCFWGVEYYFEKLTGVIHTEVGYTERVNRTQPMMKYVTAKLGIMNQFALFLNLKNSIISAHDKKTVTPAQPGNHVR